MGSQKTRITHPTLDRRVLTYLFLATACFLLLAIAATQSPYFPGDVEITRAIQSLRSPMLGVMMTLVSLSGSPPQTLVLNVLFVMIGLLCRMKAEALTLLVFILTFGTVSTWFRIGINRPRPVADLVDVLDLIKNRDYSFPSGHIVNYIAVLGFLIFVGLTRLAPSWHRNLLLFLYAALIVLMGISRVYVGDHWPSDVFAGALLGSVFLIIMILSYRWVCGRLKDCTPAPP